MSADSALRCAALCAVACAIETPNPSTSHGGHCMTSKHGEVAACWLQPTAGLVEIEPSMAWNPSVVSGSGVVQNVDELSKDMHSYLASSGMPCRCCAKTEGDCSVW